MIPFFGINNIYINRNIASPDKNHRNMIGNTIIELDRVDSTNAYANQVVGKTAFEDGTVIWAHEQFAGRGQHDHQWISEAGKNLTCTVCFHPRFLAPECQFQLNKAIALAVLDFIRHFVRLSSSPDIETETAVKWPNDIYIGNRKTGGILIEHMIMGSVLETTFAGIGINVNQTHFSPDVPNPVSLIHVLKRETMLKDALLLLCRFLDVRYTNLRETNQTGLDLEFNQNILGFNERRTFLKNDHLMEGRIIGVDMHGRLQIENNNGEIESFGHKDVEYIVPGGYEKG
jgi:BirA family transcriptional regulator, biotin operon repressor / biotin---[acetyl-CoA-carboxylase] ligase